MSDFLQPEAWLSPALLGAAIAAVGYVGKLVADLVLRLLDASRQRRTRLAELFALLRAGDVSFRAQSELRERLATAIKLRRTDVEVKGKGYDRLFADAYPTMDAEERVLHSLIRAITVHTFQPLNQSLLDWLRADTYYRAVRPDHRRLGPLAQFLSHLEAHLVLWLAKYAAWIPEHPERALVFLADEERHGIGFPKNGTQVVAKLLGHRIDPPAGT